MLGFCNAEMKLFGPLHAYVAPATAGVLSVSVPPAQIGPLLLATGVAGTALTLAGYARILQRRTETVRSAPRIRRSRHRRRAQRQRRPRADRPVVAGHRRRRHRIDPRWLCSDSATPN